MVSPWWRGRLEDAAGAAAMWGCCPPSPSLSLLISSRLLGVWSRWEGGPSGLLGFVSPRVGARRPLGSA